MIEIAILGHGVVGSGVVEVLATHKDSILKRAQNEIDIKYILDLKEFPDSPFADRFTKNFEDIIQDDDIKIVVEVMGGLHPAFEFVKQCLEKGKSVVTSNKELVASKGAELLKIAKEKNVNFLFEASVGGGIPIIRPLQTSLAPDEIEEISGILNGTTNFILTEMTENGSDFDSVLKDAQAKGYAEADPTADVEGYDACRKIAILTSLAYGKQLDFEDIYTEGITKITDRDINYASKLKAKVKIFGSSKLAGDKVSAMVAPKLITHDHPLYSVDGVFNAILVKGNMVGDVMFYGQGAGKLATASAVVSDIMEASKNLENNINIIWSADKLELMPMDEVVSKFFVRVSGNKADNKAKIKELFGEVEFVDAGYADETGFVTKDITEAVYENAAKEMGNVINKIRFDA